MCTCLQWMVDKVRGEDERKTPGDVVCGSRIRQGAGGGGGGQRFAEQHPGSHACAADVCHRLPHRMFLCVSLVACIHWTDGKMSGGRGEGENGKKGMCCAHRCVCAGHAGACSQVPNSAHPPISVRGEVASTKDGYKGLRAGLVRHSPCDMSSCGRGR